MARIIERVSGEAIYALSPSLSREIGRIIVRFAYFEQCVQEMVRQTLGLGEAASRIAVREPRVTDRLDMLRDAVGARLGGLFLFKRTVTSPRKQQSRNATSTRRRSHIASQSVDDLEHINHIAMALHIIDIA